MGRSAVLADGGARPPEGRQASRDQHEAREMKSCEEISLMISEGMDRDLDWTAQLAIRAHLLVCDGCSNFARQVQALRTFSRALVDHAHHAIGCLDE
jgi:hypothetical protein